MTTDHETNEMIKTFLLKGILIKIIYTNKQNITKFVYLMKGNWINILNLQKKVKDDAIYDICLNKEFKYKNLQIHAIEFPFWPDNVTMEEVTEPMENFKLLGDNFLEKNEKYLNVIRKMFVEIKMEFKDMLDFYLNDLNKNDDQDSYDICLLRFYPSEVKEHKNFYNKLKKDIIEKYFIHNTTLGKINNTSINIEALKILGISDENFEVTDEKFIGAAKRKWFKLIQKEIEKTYSELKNVDISFLNDEQIVEIVEYKQELELLKEHLTTISIDEMDKFTTIKEIISYWPELLQPKPGYVYEY